MLGKEGKLSNMRVNKVFGPFRGINGEKSWFSCGVWQNSTIWKSKEWRKEDGLSGYKIEQRKKKGTKDFRVINFSKGSCSELMPRNDDQFL